ncbi:MAG: glycerol-3-phosphate 1-O-acyltransferase PlsY [Dehalococcoidia bacterium]|nr:MAG: glycerol-3-phosphate 1-O-acyltransferase PlsY [Dehalococcoidia bacterium]
MSFIGLIILGYLIGSIPVGFILGKLVRGIDIREHGSGNIGMTNVMRILGVKAGVFVFFADIAKGAAAVALAWAILAYSPNMVVWGQVAGGAAAIVGHSWPIYIGFKGGRGIATGFGAVLVLSWPVGLIAFIVFLLVVGLSRYVSLGSILGALTMLLAMIPFVVLDVWSFGHFAYIVFGLVVVPIVIFRHRDNIRRLLSGTESKIGSSRTVQ